MSLQVGSNFLVSETLEEALLISQTFYKLHALFMQNNFMPTIQIRNLPTELYDKLKASAAKSRRSLTQETIHLLEQQLNVDMTSILVKRQKLHRANQELTSAKTLAMEDVVQWIREDRDK